MTDLSETDWQAQVVQLAHLLGWRHNHTRRSIGKGRKWTTATSTVGWPDLTLWHERQQRTLYVECKTDTGKVTAEQADVLSSLQAAGNEVYVWRPAMLDQVQALLAHRPPSLPTDPNPG